MRARDRVRRERKRATKLDLQKRALELAKDMDLLREIRAGLHGPTLRDQLLAGKTIALEGRRLASGLEGRSFKPYQSEDSSEALRKRVPALPHIRSVWDSPEPRNKPVRKWGYDNR